MLDPEALALARRQSALEYGCAPEDFLGKKHIVTESAFVRGARVYHNTPAILEMVTYGSCTVATCCRELIAPMQAFLARHASAYSCFELDAISELSAILAPLDRKVSLGGIYRLPAATDIRENTCPYELRVLKPQDFAGLYLPEYGNALGLSRPQYDRICVGAYDGDTLCGLAGASEDCAEMWQIGVDVLPEYRGQGIAAAIVSRLAQEVTALGRLPFYCSAWANVISMHTAERCGFEPAWSEVFCE